MKNSEFCASIDNWFNSDIFELGTMLESRIRYFYDILIEGSTLEEGYEKGEIYYIYNFKLNIFFIFKNLDRKRKW